MQGRVVSESCSSSSASNSQANLLSDDESSVSAVPLKDLSDLREPVCGSVLFENDGFSFEYLWNDPLSSALSSQRTASALVTLSQVKHIFAACLPQMGLKYVTRYLMDSNHRTIAVRLRDNQSVIRPATDQSIDSAKHSGAKLRATHSKRQSRTQSPPKSSAATRKHFFQPTKSTTPMVSASVSVDANTRAFLTLPQLHNFDGTQTTTETGHFHSQLISTAALSPSMAGAISRNANGANDTSLTHALKHSIATHKSKEEYAQSESEMSPLPMAVEWTREDLLRCRDLSPAKSPSKILAQRRRPPFEERTTLAELSQIMPQTTTTTSSCAPMRQMPRRKAALFPALRSHAIGGMCVRPFLEHSFAEVVFLAVHNAFQCKKVGRLLVRVFKQLCAEYLGIEHFVTYATDEAIGFFTKLGFSRLTSKEPLYAKFSKCIKHYDKSALMACRIYQQMDYLNLDRFLHFRRLQILAEIQERRRQIIANSAQIRAQQMSDGLFSSDKKRSRKLAIDWNTTYAAPKSFSRPVTEVLREMTALTSTALLKRLKQKCFAEGIKTDKDLYYCAKYGEFDPFNGSGKRRPLTIAHLCAGICDSKEECQSLAAAIGEHLVKPLREAVFPQPLATGTDASGGELPPSLQRSSSMRVKHQKKLLSAVPALMHVSDIQGMLPQWREGIRVKRKSMRTFLRRQKSRAKSTSTSVEPKPRRKSGSMTTVISTDDDEVENAEAMDVLKSVNEKIKVKKKLLLKSSTLVLKTSSATSSSLKKTDDAKTQTKKTKIVKSQTTGFGVVTRKNKPKKRKYKALVSSSSSEDEPILPFRFRKSPTKIVLKTKSSTKSVTKAKSKPSAINVTDEWKPPKRHSTASGLFGRVAELNTETEEGSRRRSPRLRRRRKRHRSNADGNEVDSRNSSVSVSLSASVSAASGMLQPPVGGVLTDTAESSTVGLSAATASDYRRLPSLEPVSATGTALPKTKSKEKSQVLSVSASTSVSSASWTQRNPKAKTTRPMVFKCHYVLEKLKSSANGQSFLRAVDSRLYPEYAEVVEEPMDLGTMTTRLNTDGYRRFRDFERDFKLIIRNCEDFNRENSEIVQTAQRFSEEFFKLKNEAIRLTGR